VPDYKPNKASVVTFCI